ncbi:hypothetical protein K470DRAFT_259001 [Piedraia hortae CBS 480.64]|uniref:Uncharacterized protein n=1 Tax=Piedraia hortae CBS 480.64 TaxID=1314780 RepID=A0A6A7BVK0_9PEZI|nr:hypothetical protein K470DRAFT_259001 [Piedraia hortae CBS 480.64]
MAESDSYILKHRVPDFCSIEQTFKHPVFAEETNLSLPLVEHQSNQYMTGYRITAFVLDPAVTYKDYRFPFRKEQEWRLAVSKPCDGLVDAMEKFNEFRRREGIFHSEVDFWNYRSKPGGFWEQVNGHSYAVSAVRCRGATTVTELVASERSFSILNLVHVVEKYQCHASA